MNYLKLLFLKNMENTHTSCFDQNYISAGRLTNKLLFVKQTT